MTVNFDLSAGQCEALTARPAEALTGDVKGAAFHAAIAIAGHKSHIRRRYAEALGGLSPEALNGQLGGAPLYDNFGLVVEFAAPAVLQVHDDERHLDANLKRLMSRFGPLIFRNAVLRSDLRQQVHKNIFPSLRFHSDRGRNQDNQISLFSRDPGDAEQLVPRTSSTLIVANLVAYLEDRRQQGEAGEAGGEPPRLRSSYDLFAGPRLSEALGRTVLEQPWTAPRGTGEICLLDNLEVLHASYHHDMAGRGWRIGARYLV